MQFLNWAIQGKKKPAHFVQVENRADLKKNRKRSYRNMSYSRGRIKSVAAASSLDFQDTPRITTTGVASELWPIKAEPADASSSAVPTSDDTKVRPCISHVPLKSFTAEIPATPIATPTVPLRQARPWLSLMITPIAAPKARPSSSLNNWAERSGFSGSSSAVSSFTSCNTLDMSIPAFAITNPSRCSTISTSRRYRKTSFDSSRINCTSRGSLFTWAASSQARSEGATSASRTILPSAFETIFWATTNMSPSNKAWFSLRSAWEIKWQRLSPGWTIGNEAGAKRFRERVRGISIREIKGDAHRYDSVSRRH